MKKENTVGDIQFWNTVIQDYKAKAGKERSLRRRIILAKCLNDARGYLKYAESKILHKALIVLVLTVIIFVSGCQTVKAGLYGTGRLAGAAGQDAKWIAEKLADNIQVQEGK